MQRDIVLVVLLFKTLWISEYPRKIDGGGGESCVGLKNTKEWQTNTFKLKYDGD